MPACTRPRVAAYCRVSTDKDDQLMSLRAQQEFFTEYAQKNGLELVQLYTDEGLSGTKRKNRREFNRMMADAERGLFERVYVKDVSRLARNVVDFLQSIRRLKLLGIDCRFVTANMSSNDGELTLTILAAVAQEESANLSKRVKFGKKKNAENGRVPNLVFGYDKTAGDYFHLAVNPQEAQTVRRIFTLYADGGFGAGKIAQILNMDGVKTKRGCSWTQTAICRILENPLYTGQVINGKERVDDFLTGRRVRTAPEEQYITCRPELQIIGHELYKRVQQLLGQRAAAFAAKHTRQSNKYAFSTLLTCADCHRSFRRICCTRQYGEYVRWACSTRNTAGKGACRNHTLVEEGKLRDALTEYFTSLVISPQRLLERTQAELRRLSPPPDEEAPAVRLAELRRAKSRQTQMFEADVITLEELRDRTKALNAQIRRLEKALAVKTPVLEPAQAFYVRCCQSLQSALDIAFQDNATLKNLVETVLVSADETVTVHLRPL